MVDFQLNYLDHVAINVADPTASVKWYEEVLGLKRMHFPEWGDEPIFMVAGKAGVAIFAADAKLDAKNPPRKSIRIDHFAFNVSQASFARARAHYEQLGLTYHFRDHHYFHSIYTQDPDGHTVELTTLVVPEEEVYGLSEPD